jgi:glyoxylase-like metal-dependent hydrolase (beta-lactamase superfamily II)
MHRNAEEEFTQLDYARISLGGFRITAIQTGVYYPDGGCVFGVIPKDRWTKVLTANDANRVALNLNSYVVETGFHTVVIDTGGGARVDPDAPVSGGLVAPSSLPDLLAQVGIDPLKVDAVINSHLHWDHCGGNIADRHDSAGPAFPNASYYCSKGEWQHAHEMNPRDAISYDPGQFDPLVRSGRMQLVAADYEPVPGVRMCGAPGHTRDMQVVTAESEGSTFCFFADLIPTTAHLQPGWIAAFDLFPLDSLDSKVKWLSMAAQGRWKCGFAHDPKVAFGVVNKRFALAEQFTFKGCLFESNVLQASSH